MLTTIPFYIHIILSYMQKKVNRLALYFLRKLRILPLYSSQTLLYIFLHKKCAAEYNTNHAHNVFLYSSFAKATTGKTGASAKP